MRANIDVSLQHALMNPDAGPVFASAIKKGAFIVEAKYKEEIPVNFGFARSHVTTIYSGLNALITTTARNKGVSYPALLEEGTGRFRGVDQDYPSTGRVRKGETQKGIGGIRPNKFAKRTRDATDDQVYRTVAEAIDYFTKR